METRIREKLTQKACELGIDEDYQHEAIFNEEQDVVYLKAGAIGMSSAMSLRILYRMIFPKFFDKPQKENIIMSVSDDQAKHLKQDYVDSYWEKLKNGVRVNLVEDEKDRMRFSNGNFLLCVACSPNAARSWHGDYYLDEFGWVLPRKARAVITAVSRGVVATGARRRIWSTPAEDYGEFYEICKNSAIFKLIKIYWHQVKRKSYKDAVLREKEEMHKRGLDDQWDQEYNCEFTSGADAAIPAEFIEQCIQQGYFANEMYPTSNNVYGGTDFAKEIDETYNVTLEKLEDYKYKVAYINNFIKTDYEIQLQYLNQYIEQLPTLIKWQYDLTGVGVKLAEDLTNSVFEGVNFSNPTKERLFTKVRFALMGNQLILPEHDGLIKSIRRLKKKLSESGLKQYMGKKDDAFWALALALDCARESTVTPLEVRTIPSVSTEEIREEFKKGMI